MIRPSAFFLHGPAEAVEFRIGLAMFAVLEAVQQIEVEILRARARELRGKDTVPILEAAKLPGRQLACKIERLPGIASHQHLAYGLLRFPAMIAIGGVKVVEPGLHIGVRHGAHARDVDLPVPFGQAHQPEPQFRHVFDVHLVPPRKRPFGKADAVFIAGHIFSLKDFPRAGNQISR